MEARLIHLEDAVSEMEKLRHALRQQGKKIDELEVQMRVEEIIWNVCAVLNVEKRTIDEISKLSPEQIEELGCTVPNTWHRFQIRFISPELPPK